MHRNTAHDRFQAGSRRFSMRFFASRVSAIGHNLPFPTFVWWSGMQQISVVHAYLAHFVYRPEPVVGVIDAKVAAHSGRQSNEAL